MFQKKSSFIAFAISMIVLLIGVYILISPIRSQDGMWYVFDDVHTVRTQEMVLELTSGQFPVRLLNQLGNGGGYLLFNFYSPLVYYLSALLVFAGTSPLNAVKLLFQFAYLVAALGMFFFLKSQFPKKTIIPLAGSLLLISSAYFNYDVYSRGALAELWGFSLLPWVFLSYELLKNTKHLFWVLILAILVSAQLYSHAISAFITLPFLGIRFLLDWYYGRIKIQQIILLLAAALVCLGLSASYLIPMWFEKSGVVYSQVDFVVNGYKSGFIDFKELIGISRADDLSIKPKTLGLFLTISGIVAYVILLMPKFKMKLKSQKNSEILYLSIALTTVFFIMTRVSSVVWEISPLLQMAQFPYRYAMMAVFLFVWLVSAGLSNLPTKMSAMAALLLVSLSFYLNSEFSKAAGFYFADEFIAQDPCNTTTWQAEYLPTSTSLCLSSNDGIPLASSSGQLEIVSLKITKNERRLDITTNGQSGELIVGKYAYPGWRLTSNIGQKQIFPYGKEGVIGASLANEDKNVIVEFKNTTARNLGNGISAVSILITGCGLIWLSVRQRSKTKLN